MAYEIQELTLPLAAGEALTKYRFVKAAATEGQVDLCDAATDRPLGVTQQSAAAQGDAAPVDVLGVIKVEAGAAVAFGAVVGTDASGRAVAKSTAGDFIAGTALEAAGAAGDIIAVMLTPNGVVHA